MRRFAVLMVAVVWGAIGASAPIPTILAEEPSTQPDPHNLPSTDQIPAGMRVISLSSVGGVSDTIRPGDVVDILSLVNQPETLVDTVLRGRQVFAIDDEVLSLIVMPREAEQLLLAGETGRLYVLAGSQPEESKSIDQEIRRLGEDVRVLRRDVLRLIELLENQPFAREQSSEAAADDEGAPPSGRSLTDAEPVSDDFIWQRLGIRVRQRNGKIGRYRGGLEVLAVRTGSPAAQEDIREGDVLVGLDKWETVQGVDLDYVLKSVGLAGEVTIKFYIIRGNKTMFGKLTLPAWPKADNSVESKRNPLSLLQPEFSKLWDLSLDEVISFGLHNFKVIRNLGGVIPFGFSDALSNTVPSSSNDSSKGIQISPLNADIDMADFEAATRNLICDIEGVYWKLWAAQPNRYSKSKNP